LFQSTPRGKIDPKLPDHQLAPISSAFCARFVTSDCRVCQLLLLGCSVGGAALSIFELIGDRPSNAVFAEGVSTQIEHGCGPTGKMFAIKGDECSGRINDLAANGG